MDLEDLKYLYLRNIAENLVDLSYDHDPYEFHDNYGDREEAISDVLENLEIGDVDDFILFCNNIIEDYEEDLDKNGYDYEFFEKTAITKENLERLKEQLEQLYSKYSEENEENIERE